MSNGGTTFRYEAENVPASASASIAKSAKSSIAQLSAYWHLNAASFTQNGHAQRDPASGRQRSPASPAPPAHRSTPTDRSALPPARDRSRRGEPSSRRPTAAAPTSVCVMLRLDRPANRHTSVPCITPLLPARHRPPRASRPFAPSRATHRTLSASPSRPPPLSSPPPPPPPPPHRDN